MPVDNLQIQQEAIACELPLTGMTFVIVGFVAPRFAPSGKCDGVRLHWPE